MAAGSATAAAGLATAAAGSAGLTAYSVGGPTGDARRMHLNEFRGTHAREVEDACFRAIGGRPGGTSLCLYSSGPPPALLEALAAYARAESPECIAVAAGSDEVLRAAIDTCGLRNQDTVIVGTPTYTHFTHFARLRGLRVREYAIGLETSPEDHIALLDLYADEMTRGALVYLGSPNNPTGDLWAAGAVAELAERFPASLFLVDEAYTEFAGALTAPAPTAGEDAGEILNARSCAPLASRVANVVVSRTFSKAFGLAALRAGYAVGSPATAAQLKIALSPKAFGLLQGNAVSAVLRLLPDYLKYAREAARVAEKLVADLRAAKWWVVTAPANFVLVHAGDSAAAVAALAARGIHIRDRGDLPGLAGFVRVSVGDKTDAAAVVEGFRALRPPGAAIQRLYTPKGRIAALRALLRKTLRAAAAVAIYETPIWLHGGSLLGAVRHGGIIPWDDDVDLAYTIPAGADDFLAARGVAAFARAGLTLQRNRTDAYWQVGTNRAGETISPVHIDLFPFAGSLPGADPRPDPDAVYESVDERFRAEDPGCPAAHCNIRFGPGELLPLKTGSFYGEAVGIPREAEKVLARALGPDFMTRARVRVAGAPAEEYAVRDSSPA